MLTARTQTDPYIEAAVARRGVAYVCRSCGADVIFKPGRIRASHFAHRPDTECAQGAPMSAAHLEAQQKIAEVLRGRGLSVELEAPLTSLAGDRRIDVLAWQPERPQARVAIEVQASEMGEAMVEARTASYEASGVRPLWLRLLDFSGFRAAQVLPFAGTAWIERYRARAWERWAHDHLGGRLWFMDSGTGLVWRGQFVTAHRGRERAAARGDAGETAVRGADWMAARQWVDLELDGPFELAELRLGRGSAPGPDGRERSFAWFVPPGEEGRRPPFQPTVRATFTAERRGASRSLHVLVDGEWVPTPVDGALSDWRTKRPTARPIVRPLRRS